MHVYYFKIHNKMIDLDNNNFVSIAPDACVTKRHTISARFVGGGGGGWGWGRGV